MKRNYLELQHHLISRFPDLQNRVSGSIDQPAEVFVMLANITNLLQILGMAFFIFGDSLLKTFGISSKPKWLSFVQDNKMMCFIGLFMLNNMANSNLSTGAFEVEYNGIVVWSKLETGRMPSVMGVVQGIENVRRQYAASVAPM